MATYTSTVFSGNQAKAVHVGVNPVSGQLVWTAASSSGDVGFLVKVPHGAVVIDVIEDHTTGATTQPVSFGMATGAAAGGGGNLSCFIASGTQGAVNRRSVVGLPLTVSVSDLDPNRYGIFAAKVEGGSATTSLIINFTILYRTDVGP